MKDFIIFLQENYSWLIPSCVGLLLTVVTFLKKGSVSKADADKILTAVSLLGTATSYLMEKEAKNKNEKISSTKKSEEISQD